MKTVWMGLILTALLASLGAQAEVFRWTDKDGKVHYADQPPPKGEVNKPRLYDSRVEQDKLPFETRKAAERFPLTLYVSEDCKEHCTSAREWLKARKAPYTEKSIKTKEDVEALGRITGKKEAFLPTLTIGTQTIEGFSPASWGSALDTSGYPK